MSIGPELGSNLARVASTEGISAMEAIRRAVAEYVERRPTRWPVDRGAADSALQLLKTADRLANPYQIKVASWRLSRTLRFIEGVAAQRADIDAWPPGVYLFRILTEILSALDEGDQVLIVTNLRFWDAGKADGVVDSHLAGAYLAAQEEAINRRMALHRVFLLGLDDPLAHLGSHLAFLRRLQPIHGNRVRVDYRRFANVDDAVTRLGNFVIVRRPTDSGGDSGCMVIEPVYYGTVATAANVHLRILFSHGPGAVDPETRFFLDRFTEAATGAVSLDEALGP